MEYLQKILYMYNMVLSTNYIKHFVSNCKHDSFRFNLYLGMTTEYNNMASNFGVNQRMECLDTGSYFRNYKKPGQL